MIYDTFPFFNELDLLEIRLHELDAVVDRFVLVEATRTHANQPKPLYFAEVKERFAPFADKIIHIVVADTPDTNNAWLIERFQRDAIVRGLTNCQPNDLILMSDVDEIPRASAVRQAEEILRSDLSAPLVHAFVRTPLAARVFRSAWKRRHPFVALFHQIPAIYYFNLISTNRFTPGTRAVRYRDLGRPRDLRRFGGAIDITNAGWHFTCLGGVSELQEKITAFAHQEYNTTEARDPAHLAQMIERGDYAFAASTGPDIFAPVPVDERFPDYLRAHQERFADRIKEGI